MAMDSRLQVPPEIKAGEVFAVRIVIRHPMETGLRFDNSGKVIPANTIRKFTAKYNGKDVFVATLGSGVGANPYLQFFVRAPQSAQQGEIVCDWYDETGNTGLARATVNVV